MVAASHRSSPDPEPRDPSRGNGHGLAVKQEPGIKVWYELAAALWREGLSLPEIAAKFTQIGRPMNKWSLHQLLIRARAHGVDVPPRNLKAAQARRWADPATRERQSRSAKAVWQRPDYGHVQLANLAAQTERMRGTRNPYENKRFSLLHELKKDGVPDRERFAIADQYFPTSASKASELGFAPDAGGHSPAFLDVSPTTAPRS